MRIVYFIGAFLYMVPAGQAQSRTTLTLKEIILLAQSQSPNYKLAQTQKELSYYEFVTYKSDLRPQISVYGNMPVYSKQYTSVVQPDGTIQFLPVQQNLSSLGFSLGQVLAFSGGLLSVNTELNHFYDFQSKTGQYNGTPVFFSLQQPLFAFNEWKWRKKIEPLRLEESKRQYVEEIEHIAQQTTRLYFDLLNAQSNIQVAAFNLSADSLNYLIEQKRINLGTTTEDRILQLRLQQLKSHGALEKARYDFTIAELSLLTYIGYKDSLTINALLPEQIPLLQIDVSKAIAYARLNRPEFIAFERKNREAERDVAQLKAQKQQLNLLATYGLNRAAPDAGTIYRDPRSQQTLSVGINLPIVDWGRRKARYSSALALQKLTEFNNELEGNILIQEVTTLARNISLLTSNIALGKTTDSVARRRFQLASGLYQTGKLTVTELNVAQSEKDNARRAYIASLRDFWDAYYLLRMLTLYDFEKDSKLYISR